MEVILRNTKRQPFLTTMYHDIVCRRRQSCSCKIFYTKSASGKRISSKQPQSFQINALTALKVDAYALHLPHVKAALKSGWLIREDVAAPVAKPKKEAAPKPEPKSEPVAETNGKSKKGRR